MLDFNIKRPNLVVVDDFLSDPDATRDMALRLPYSSDENYYKGLRSDKAVLYPYLKEELERILNCQIIDWLDQSANGVFQITNSYDQLVWHADSQDYAAAIYLTPNAPIAGGTSFWRHKDKHFRKFEDASENFHIDQSDLTSQDNWELVESIAGLYNRLVIWDAHLIHSATSYQEFSDLTNSRLVQLFFFNIEK